MAFAVGIVVNLVFIFLKVVRSGLRFKRWKWVGESASVWMARHSPSRVFGCGEVGYLKFGHGAPVVQEELQGDLMT